MQGTIYEKNHTIRKKKENQVKKIVGENKKRISHGYFIQNISFIFRSKDFPNQEKCVNILKWKVKTPNTLLITCVLLRPRGQT